MEADFNEYEFRKLPREKLVPLIRDHSHPERAVVACYAYNDRDGLFSTSEMHWWTRPIPIELTLGQITLLLRDVKTLVLIRPEIHSPALHAAQEVNSYWIVTTPQSALQHQLDPDHQAAL